MKTRAVIHSATMLLAVLLLAVNAHGQTPTIDRTANINICTSNSTDYVGREQLFGTSTQRIGRETGQLFAVSQGGSCPEWTKCPLDGAQSMLVRTEYEGIVAIGVYEHTTTTGETHKFRMRCN